MAVKHVVGHWYEVWDYSVKVSIAITGLELRNVQRVCDLGIGLGFQWGVEDSGVKKNELGWGRLEWFHVREAQRECQEL